MKKVIMVLAMTFLASAAHSQPRVRGFRFNLSFGNQGVCMPAWTTRPSIITTAPSAVCQPQPQGYWKTVPIQEKRIVGYWCDAWGYQHPQYQWFIVGYTQVWVSY
jgi:hypothetical protein